MGKRRRAPHSKAAAPRGTGIFLALFSPNNLKLKPHGLEMLRLHR
jgi:hypothetical protein